MSVWFVTWVGTPRPAYSRLGIRAVDVTNVLRLPLHVQTQESYGIKPSELHEHGIDRIPLLSVSIGLQSWGFEYLMSALLV